jgi:hypothetical protein
MSRINPLLYALPGLPFLLRGAIQMVLRAPTTWQYDRLGERDVDANRVVFLTYQQVVLPAVLLIAVLSMATGRDLQLPAYDLLVAFFATMLGVNVRVAGFISVRSQWSDALQETIQLCMVLAVIEIIYLSKTPPGMTIAAAIIGASLWAVIMIQRLIVVCRTIIDARIQDAVLADRGKRNVAPDLTVLPGSRD